MVVALAALLVGAGPAAAQRPLAEVITFLLNDDMMIAPGTGGTHQLDFVPIPGQMVIFVTAIPSFAGATTFERRGNQFNSAIIEQLPTFPIGSSSGGFLYAFNPAVGTFTRSTRSFGASYAERPLTGGKGTVAVGFSVQRVVFDQFDGGKLDGGDLRFHFLHRDNTSDLRLGRPLTPETSDVMEATLRMRIRSQTMLTTLTVGVTDRLDLGVTIPVVEATLEATVDKRILRLGTAGNPLIHSFNGAGLDRTTATGGGTASGLGDVRVQGKYNVIRHRFGAIAAGGDLRLPTGDSRNLLGNGTLHSRIYGIASTGTRAFSPHANIGMTIASRNFETVELIGEPDDEINYTLGFDWSVVPRATVSADLLGRRPVSGNLKHGVADRTLRYVTTTGGPVQNVVVREFQGVDHGDSHLMQAVLGGKVGPWRTMLFSLNVLLPVTDLGLRNKPALSLGVEYTF